MTTALGPIEVCRPYLWHPTESGRFTADELLGLDGFLTRHARRLVTLAGIEHSFARAQQVLAEFCGWDVDDEVIRQTTHAEARRVAEQRPERNDAWPFAQAEGEIEVLIDAGKVNTRTGWRDVKFGLFLKRKPGPAATPAGWDERHLPPPTTRAVVAAIEEAESFGARLRRESDRLGVTTAPAVTVLGDGAEWIWNLASEHLPQAAGVLDMYHLMEHVSGAMKAMGGAGDAIRTRCDAARQVVLSEGKPGLERWLGAVFAGTRRSARRSHCWTWPRMWPSTRPGWGTPSGWRPDEASAAGWWKGGSNSS
ncbi:hypothetical protein VT84_31205 [Gemmata sp. SH-PL17]|uniref:hypothetical protein n=1 Tax=Gemmata sp. SH-PL17 TaxID=1630693 RepID=UPI00078CA0AF|nr:hypothetical protein [Gemmata sp. SH-PL17]AMV28903.1 hypothetical protein VT84_31205 [Gemmata sp. SH-PL17]